MTLAEMADYVVDRVGTSDDATKALAKRFIIRRYQMVYDATPWPESEVTFQLRTTENEIILPNWLDKVLQVVVDQAAAAHNIQMASRQTVMLANPAALTDLGSLVGFTMLPGVAVHTHPGGNLLQLVSSEASDTNQTARLRGMFNGLEIEEEIMLTGITAAPSAYYYDEITHFSKPKTLGYVHLQSAAAGNDELQVLLPQDRERRHLRIQLHHDFETGADEQLITILGKRKCIPLRHDNDTPQIANIENALIAYGMSDLLERERQFGKAQLKLQEAVALTNSMILAERDQKQSHVQIIPQTETYAAEYTLY